MRLNDLATAMRAAWEENRLRILCAVFSGRRGCVSELASELGLSVATASHHMNVLARAGLLVPKREGKRIRYEPSRAEAAVALQKVICKHI